ncbi:6306_t:CDS:2, partial [Dentiscutata erythropus]
INQNQNTSTAQVMNQNSSTPQVINQTSTAQVMNQNSSTPQVINQNQNTSRPQVMTSRPQKRPRTVDAVILNQNDLIKVLYEKIIKIEDLQDTTDGLTKELKDTTNVLTNQINILNEINESLESEITNLDRALGRGEYNSATTRVLELIDNPEARYFAVRQSTLDGLKLENEHLLIKLEEMKKKFQGINIDNTDFNVIPMSALENVQREKSLLEEQILEKDKKILRLKEAMENKSIEFNKILSEMFGYYFESLEDNGVKVRSIYADDYESLTFKPNENGKLQLTGGNSDVIKTFDNFIKFWIVKNGSVPCFMANILVKQFERLIGRNNQNDGSF